MGKQYTIVFALPDDDDNDIWFGSISRFMMGISVQHADYTR